MDDVFIRRARQLVEAKEFLLEEPSLSSATALLAVHSGIAFNDALLTAWMGKASKNDDHQTAADVTENECRDRKVDTSGIRHLRTLLKSKSEISYGNQSVTHAKALALSESAKRFETWIYKVNKELAKWEQQLPVPDASA